MTSSIHRTPRSGKQSLFFQDLGTPASTRRTGGKFTATSGQSAAVSALRRENGDSSNPPPPPIFTLEDRFDFSSEPGIPEYLMSPDLKSDPRPPVQTFNWEFSTPKSDISTPYAGTWKLPPKQNQQTSLANSSCWSPVIGGGSVEQGDKGKGSPAEGMVQPVALITLPPPQEVARPEMKESLVPVVNSDEEEWITVYGFLPVDTSLVLLEFENCGLILKHVPGPREANWMHILYQNQSAAQKALSKNGTFINGVLMIGVKRVDPQQCHTLNQKQNNPGFIALPPPPHSTRNFEPNGFKVVQNGSSTAQPPSGTIAMPTKSRIAKVMNPAFVFWLPLKYYLIGILGF